jgi:hypothetical protein
MRLGMWLCLGATVLLAGCPFPDAPRVQGIGGTGGGSTGGDRLAFLVGPTNAFTGVTISPMQVAAIDTTTGLVDTSFTGLVTLSLSNNPTGATLTGTTSVNASGGIAFYADIAVSLAGTGYTLAANASSIGSVTSGSFTITDAP